MHCTAPNSVSGSQTHALDCPPTVSKTQTHALECALAVSKTQTDALECPPAVSYCACERPGAHPGPWPICPVCTALREAVRRLLQPSCRCATPSENVAYFRSNWALATTAQGLLVRKTEWSNCKDGCWCLLRRCRPAWGASQHPTAAMRSTAAMNATTTPVAVCQANVSTACKAPVAISGTTILPRKAWVTAS